MNSGRLSGRVNFSGVLPLVTISVAVSALYLGRDVLIPFALALLFSFLLTPPVTWLEKLHLGRIPSVLVVFLAAFSAFGAVSWLGLTQLAEIVGNLPVYQTNINRKLIALQKPGLMRSLHAIAELEGAVLRLSGDGEEHRERTSAASNKGEARRRTAPLPVEVVKPTSDLRDALGPLGSSFAHVITTVLGVLIFTLFMLVQRGDLRNRLLRLFGVSHLNVLTTALDDAAKRVSHYLIAQCMINGTFGLLLGTALHFVGVPNASFWGMLGAVLRFVPYIGTLVAGSLPTLLALAIFEGWSRPLATFGVFAAIELSISAGIEPWFCGVRTGLSSLAVLFFASFWTILWGPIGLVLSVPLTVCLLVLGRYVPQLEFLDVVLGDEAVLPPEAHYYQRLLALDDDEAREVAENFLKEKTPLELYDSVIVPALRLAEEDRHQDALDEERETFVYRSTRDLIEEIGDRDLPNGAAARSSGPKIFCVGARDEADELVGLMLAQVLREEGYSADIISAKQFDPSSPFFREAQVDILFISALPPFGLSQARALCRKARRFHPGLRIIVGIWDSNADISKIRERLGAQCFDAFATRLEDAKSLVSESTPTEDANVASRKLAVEAVPALKA
ncbi:MAG: AI-2E family transporter [Bryobacteraceae bacterium]